MYHYMQKKCYPQRCLLARFEATLDFIAVANLLAHNNMNQILLQSALVNCSFSDNLTPFEVTFILLAIVHVCIGLK